MRRLKRRKDGAARARLTRRAPRTSLTGVRGVIDCAMREKRAAYRTYRSGGKQRASEAGAPPPQEVIALRAASLATAPQMQRLPQAERDRSIATHCMLRSQAPQS